jgi:hypothetical protein
VSDDGLRPTAGARFVLELTGVDGAAATYRAAIYTLDAVHEATATLREDGGVAVGALIPAIADELAAKLAMFAKLVARGAVARREAGEKTWPVRVMRWRGPGR